MEKIYEILQLNDIHENSLNSLEEAKTIEDKLFTFNDSTLGEKERILFEINSLKRRLLDFSIENIGKDEYIESTINEIYNLLELEKIGEAKIKIVFLSYEMETTTRFYTVLYEMKKNLFLNNINYKKDEDYNNNLGGKKR